MGELEEKEERIRQLMAEKNVDALLLLRLSNFYWATGGRDCCVITSVERGEAALLFTPEGKYLLTNNIETPRLIEEEGLQALGYEFYVDPWHRQGESIARMTRGLKLGADMPWPGAIDLSAEVARLRFTLTPAEEERYRWLGRKSAEAIETTARRIRPGMTEREVGAMLAAEVIAWGIMPTLILVGADERIFKYRHPLMTERRVERYVMLVLCARRWGLVASVTRLVHFGPLPNELQRKEQALARVDATYIAETVPGKRIADIFQRAAHAYAEAGFPEEWQKHWQGGLAGYESREYESSPTCPEIVGAHQAFAWNPSITGVKSEDTFLVSEHGREFITCTGDWPMIPVEIAGQVIERPAILRR